MKTECDRLVEQLSACGEAERGAPLGQLRKKPLLEICGSLGPRLCSAETVNGALLSLAECSIGRETITHQEVEVVLSFFLDKINTKKTFETSLYCLDLVIRDFSERSPCSLEMSSRLFSALKGLEIEVQNCPTKIRRNVYTIFLYILTEAMVAKCGADDLSFILTSVDGESDPESVLMLFKINYAVCSFANEAVFSEICVEFFDSVANYFPIIFTKPPDCRVTKEDLVCGLSKCMTSDKYAEHSVPFMLSRLSSPSAATKCEVVGELLRCVSVYSDALLAKYSRDIVKGVRDEILKLSAYTNNSENSPVNKCIVESLNLLKTLSKRVENVSEKSALDIFSPVVDGLLSSVDSQREVCSCYATMVFDIISNSLVCCSAVGPYVLTMLAVSCEEEKISSNILLLFSSACGGINNFIFNNKDIYQIMCEKLSRVRQIITALMTGVFKKCHEVGRLIL
ncbi:hypothetical protein AGDE_14035 [Angomonas deanei]|uniref:MMS19 nucleotide excision repair protein n=1 Tax=Angomonas deanei TaxID=59799 RepID=A0A7G2CUB1_9TRYP|nr:hypothetical protein AGDE_14035 [Angomonas deanei]CAD2222889.1 Dos2-interacting transcription regulator of RNA-Pol-II, putative [Angomonas deanei]|eukprot:EPY21506.1 hypothetical protein AGDE_14035 [Angomonas deanei]